MLRTVGPQGSLFELLLPAGMRVLSGELAEIDELLDDERFFRPFRPFFNPVDGRPSIPIETYWEWHSDLAPLVMVSAAALG